MTNLIAWFMTTALCLTAYLPTAQAPNDISNSIPQNQPKIQVALCLDTSNSMDGLIDQAKSQLWKMVNELATSKRKGKAPVIEIALFDYGNSRLSASQGYIRKVADLTADLDLISEKLFELNTRGGDEYCGWTIKEATNQLEWSDSNDDLKLIIIAGNEPFNQGPVDYKVSCKNAIAKGIMINTIHCGDYNKGVRTFWKDAAECADGKYLNINQDQKVVHIKTPYDDEILKLNGNLNDTYIGYGREGSQKKMRQSLQDANAAQYSQANTVERAVSKSGSAYKNESWDLVDAIESDEEVLEKVEKESLPEEMKNLSKEEQKTFLAKKKADRKAIQEKIKALNVKRQKHIEAERQKSAESLTLDNVMLKAIREQATQKKFKFKKK